MIITFWKIKNTDILDNLRIIKIFIASMKEHINSDWLTRVQYLLYCTLDIALCEGEKQ